MGIKNSGIPLQDSEKREKLLYAVEAIEINVEAYLNGRRAGWLAVASQLFILLCDPNPHSSLIRTLLPDAAFYPLATQIQRARNKDDVAWLMHSPAPMHFEPGKVTVVLFDLSKPKIPFKKWLKQVIGVHNYEDEGHYITIENLIYHARNQMGAGHLDTEWDRISKSLEYPQIRMNGIAYPFYEWAIIMIGHIVIDEIKVAFQP
ncbi:MAG: hypothetical protein AB2L11_10960 [Syntrophobacteraceae bacterium]